MLRILVSAGGTGGGVYPALAVVAALAERADVLWVGDERGMEADLVRRAGIPFEHVPAAGVHGVGPRALPGNTSRLVRGVLAARGVLRRFHPHVLFLTGGYVGVPVAFAGRKVPSAVFVPDIEPGLALRWMCRHAEVIAVITEDSRRYYSPGKQVVVTGYPIRPALEQVDPDHAREWLQLDSNRPVLLVFGGSRGARSINQALWGCLPELLEHAQLVHLTGSLDWPRVAEVMTRLSPAQRSDYHPFEYLHEEMGAALAAADLAVSRAGAAVLGEFPHFGLPAVLVPYPHAWRYQRVNAEYLASRGAAVVVEDGTLGDRLSTTVRELLSDPERLRQMGAAARGLDKPGAANAIAVELERLAGEGPARRRPSGAEPPSDRGGGVAGQQEEPHG